MVDISYENRESHLHCRTQVERGKPTEEDTLGLTKEEKKKKKKKKKKAKGRELEKGGRKEKVGKKVTTTGMGQLICANQIGEAIGIGKPSEYMLICETLSSRHRSFKETYEEATPSGDYRKGSLGYLIDISRLPSSSGLDIQKHMLLSVLSPYEDMLKDKDRGLFIITDLY
jgi:hypothetical protein